MIQVVVYNQSDDTPTFLDVQEAPGISVNYSFADIRHPDKRDSSYSHTFKVPFTQTNNQFFENCFEVNLTTSTFNPQIKTNAVIMVDSLPQLEGSLQIKNIYKNAKLYEVVVFGEGGDLFSQIKDKKLIDAFRDIDDGVTLDTQWNHVLTYSNIVASWSGGLTNTAGETKNDIVYPIVDYGRTGEDGNNQSYTANQSGSVPIGINSTDPAFLGYMVQPGQQRPAILIKTIIQQILEKAGFYFTSSFINGSFFGRVYMLLATETDEFATEPIGGLKVGLTSTVALQANNTPHTIHFDKETPTATFYDVDNAYSSGTGYTVGAGGEYKFGYQVKLTTTASGTTNDYASIYAMLVVNGQTVETKQKDGGAISAASNQTITLSDEFPGVFLQPNDIVTFKLKNNSDDYAGNGIAITIQPYASATDVGTYFTLLGSNTSYENRTVYVPDNMPDIKQSDFLKDIIQRFNLVVVPDPQNEKHLTISPFNDFLDAGTSKDWEDKLDLSKEVIVRFTNEMMNQTIEFKDEEDDDQTNFYHQETFGEIYGQFIQDNKDKEFAKEEPLTNDPVFSPFIPTKLNTPDGTSLPPGFEEMLLHRSYSLEGGQVKPVTTKPKMFWYNIATGGYTLPVNYSWWDSVNQTVQSTNKYPNCSNFAADTVVTSTTKDLRWGGGYPYAFNTPFINATYTNENLFNVYWARYINEIYSEEARIMTAYVYLDEQDIFNFNFNDKIFINNCFWRINKIEDYQVGENTPTKVEFIKIITKTAHNCNIAPGTFNANGSVSFVLTTDLSTAADATQECCEQWGFIWSPLSLLANRCRWKPLGTVPIRPQIPRNASASSSNTLRFGSSNPLKTIPDSSVLTTKNLSNKIKSGVMILTYTGQTDTADTTEIFIQGVSNSRFQIPVNTYCTLEATMNSVQSGLDNNSGSIGSCSFSVYRCGVKNVNGTVALVGAQSRASLIEDGDAGTRDLTFGVANTEGNQALTLSVGGNANMRILWSVELKAEFNHFIGYGNTNAIWMDDNNIIFQDGDQMLWN